MYYILVVAFAFTGRNSHCHSISIPFAVLVTHSNEGVLRFWKDMDKLETDLVYDDERLLSSENCIVANVTQGLFGLAFT